MEPSSIDRDHIYHRSNVPVTGFRCWGALIATALLLQTLAACGRESDPPVDFSGEPPMRIVAISPELAGLLAELGVGARVVGADSLSRAMPALENAADLGEPCEIDVEAARALRPDLALVLGTACGCSSASRSSPSERTESSTRSWSSPEPRTASTNPRKSGSW
jgi:ABC-type Fe3+-hydroxamate transport system substrate-binding protein